MENIWNHIWFLSSSPIPNLICYWLYLQNRSGILPLPITSPYADLRHHHLSPALFPSNCLLVSTPTSTLALQFILSKADQVGTEKMGTRLVGNLIPISNIWFKNQIFLPLVPSLTCSNCTSFIILEMYQPCSPKRPFVLAVNLPGTLSVLQMDICLPSGLCSTAIFEARSSLITFKTTKSSHADT